MNIEESKINLKNLICEYKRTIQLYGDFFIGLQEIQAVETLLTAYEKEKEKNKNARERIEYYLVENMRLNDFDERNKELRKIEKILEE